MLNERVKEAMNHTENPLNEIGALWYFSFINPNPFTLSLLDVFKDNEYTYMVTEVCAKGELFDIVSKNGRLSNSFAQQIMIQLFMSLNGLHSSHACHRDVSLENILIHSDGTARLMDFGQAFITFQNKGDRCVRGIAGKDLYRPPEAHSLNPYDGCRGDMFSAGVVLFVMLIGSPPWENTKPEDSRFNYVLKAGLPALLQHWKLLDSINPLAVDLMGRLLSENPLDRPSAAECLSHPWLRGEFLAVLDKEEIGVMRDLKALKYLAGRSDQIHLNFVRGGLSSKDELLCRYKTPLDEATELFPYRLQAENILFGKYLDNFKLLKQRQHSKFGEMKQVDGSSLMEWRDGHT